MPQVISFPNLFYSEKTHEVDIVDDKINQIQILKYMGNKRALLGWLIPELSKQIKKGDTVLDLFAGTSSVGYALKPLARIIANDIQEYSSVISQALLLKNEDVQDNEFEKYLAKAFNRNLNYLNDIFENLLKQEEKLINSFPNDDYFIFSSKIPSYKSDRETKYDVAKYSTESYISRKRKNPDSFPYLLFTTYYPTGFFSIKQCIEIDSLRFAIDQVTSKSRRAIYLSCLLFAISKAVNSSGHFAEHLNPHSDNSKKIIVEHRRISITENFLLKLRTFKSLYSAIDWDNKVYNLDYKKLIPHLKRNGELEEIKLIYIDPPYTTAQYSRYYHIAETLVKYDYPTVGLDKKTGNSFKGRYREDRHQSPFSQKTRAEGEFNEMLKLLSNNSSATLAISYSDNSIIKPIDSLLNLAEKYYKVSSVKNGYIHSAQGSRFRVNGKGNKDIYEYLLICKLKN